MTIMIFVKHFIANCKNWAKMGDKNISFKVTFILFLCNFGLIQSQTTKSKLAKVLVGAPLHDTPISVEWASEGGVALLPCNITAPLGDSPQLIIFYKGDNPIYSVDARSDSLQDAVHWVSPQINQRHPRFEMSPPAQGLFLFDVASKEEDEYHCRVDFHDSPTRNVRVRLNVASAPTRIVIRNEAGMEVTGVIGPYPLAGVLRLTCQVDGGRPTPSVWWYHSGSILVDDVMEAVSDESVSNTFSMQDLSREHLLMVLTCRASTHNLTEDVTASVKLDLIFPPTEVRILGTENPLRAGWTYDITCEVWGSRPPPSITWRRDGAEVISAHQLTDEGNVSRSKLEIIPTRGDEEAVYSCRAENELLPSGGAIEQSKRITVLYPPQVSLQIGPSIDPDDIKEGGDIYFECSVEANPPSHHVTWFRDKDELLQDLPAGIIRSNLTLVLQQVNRFSSGEYVCVASNSLASTSSNKIQLNVKYRPVCSPNQKVVYGGGQHEPVRISCSVDALPKATDFTWAFNTSTELVYLPRGRAKIADGESMVTYKPQTHLDYGSLLCWGTNKVGIQDKPCVFQVVPAGPPETPQNCSAWHEFGAAGEMMVLCRAGRDGGLPQRFTLEISRQSDGESVAVFPDRTYPRFSVTSLKPGTEYALRITASNPQGAAPAVVFDHFTPIDIAKERTSASAAGGEANGLSSETMIAIGCGVVTAVFLTLGALLVAQRMRMRRRQGHPHPPVTTVSDEEIQSSFAEDGSRATTPSPDVILASDEGEAAAKEVCQRKEKVGMLFSSLAEDD